MKKRHSSVIFIFTLLAFAFPPTVLGGSKVIKVLSFNIAGLPGKQKNKGRFERIAEILEERRQKGTHPDVILFQEAFKKNSTQAFRATQYKNIYKGPRVRVLKTKVFSGGLYAVSDHDFLEKNKKSFRGACTSWDCYSNKGLAHVRLKMDDVPFPIEIMTTHMQSSGTSEFEKAVSSRYEQLMITKEFMEKNIDPSLPLIFAGDFNLKPNDPSKPNYPLLLNITDAHNSGEFCLLYPDFCKIDPETPLEEILGTNDQHLYRSSAEVRVDPVYVSRNFREIYDGDHLSDHMGYEVHYLLTW